MGMGYVEDGSGGGGRKWEGERLEWGVWRMGVGGGRWQWGCVEDGSEWWRKGVGMKN